MLIGLLSDTHGHFDDRIASAFAGIEAILHAGDVGSLEVIERLEAIAPVTAVRGNNDERPGGLGLPLRQDRELAGRRVHLVHQRRDAQPAPGTDVVVFGHSHQALVEEREHILYINPGAAGRVGFHKVLTVALLRIEDGALEPHVVELGARPPRARRVKDTAGVRPRTRAY